MATASSTGLVANWAAQHYKCDMAVGMTRDQIEQLVTSSRPAPGRRLASSVLLVLSLVCVAIFTFGQQPRAGKPWVGAVGAWVLVAGVLAWRWMVARRQRQAMRELSRACDAAELNEWPKVGEIASDLLRQPVTPESARIQGLLLLATATERARQYDLSELLFETILDEHRADGQQLLHAKLGLAAVKLRTEQLTDAVQILDRLRRVELPPMLRAGVELLRLFQEVLMGHLDAAVATVNERRPLFRRYLSTRAGYGYALLAAAMHGLGRIDEAAALWRDATLLVRPNALIERYDMLRGLADQYPASEYPV